MTPMQAVAMFALWAFGRPNTEELERIAQLLHWTKGSVVADFGAGHGDVARYAASVVGPSGIVYAAELDTDRLRALKRLEAVHRNVRAIASSENRTGLTQGCCDSIVVRGVYHHLTNPAAVNADLRRALKPGGRVAFIDFPPKWLLSWLFPVKGAPAGHGGHGITREALVRELQQAGFRIELEIADWPGNQYCILAQNPAE